MNWRFGRNGREKLYRFLSFSIAIAAMMAIAAKSAYVASVGKVKFVDEGGGDSEDSGSEESVVSEGLDSDWEGSVDSEGSDSEESAVKFTGIGGHSISG